MAAHKTHRFSGRSFLNIFTLVAVILLIYFAREDLIDAWHLLFSIKNWWLLIFLIPLQILVYYSMSEIGISYLEKRKQITKLTWFEKVKMALELNFVNHIMPSGGMSGFGYGLWRLKKHGVDKTAALMSQLVRTVMSFAAFVPLLILAAFWISVRNHSNSMMVALSTLVATGIIFIIIFGGYLIANKRRLTDFAKWFSNITNKLIFILTFHKVKKVISKQKLVQSFSSFHKDYIQLIHSKRVLRKPLLWGIVWVLADIAMFEIVFITLGQIIDPMILLLAYGAASVAGFAVITPGGAGAYEAAFIAVLVANGVGGGIAASGTLLTRIILMVGTLITGYYFYHKQTKKDKPST